MSRAPCQIEGPHSSRQFGPDGPRGPKTRRGTSGVQPSLPLVIAGYNGGADAVARWLAAWPEPPEADLFAENISYTETRKYVQRVLGFLQTYRYIYGD